MKNLNCLNKYRVPLMGDMGDEYCGAFKIKLEGSNLTFTVVASNGGGWEHVSVSTEYRCPRWNEMCRIKDLFFNENETVMQLHPPKEEYINNHEYCLHLWRPSNEKIPMPPKSFV